MNFNEKKYRKCIGHLIELKISLVLFYLIILACFGALAGYTIMDSIKGEYYIIAIGASIGGIIGLLIGLFSTWGIEMKIQEAYWRIDVVNELEKQTSIANKNTPIAKTVVAIENKQIPEKKLEEEKV